MLVFASKDKQNKNKKENGLDLSKVEIRTKHSKLKNVTLLNTKSFGMYYLLRGEIDYPSTSH